MARRVVWCEKSNQRVNEAVEEHRWRTTAMNPLSANLMTVPQFVEKCSHTPDYINDVVFVGTFAIYQDYLMFVRAFTSLPSLKRFALVNAYPQMFQFGRHPMLLENVTDIMIRSCQLRKVPTNVFTALGRQLNSLDLSNNFLSDLSSISQLLSECRNLLNINISRNRFVEIPSEISGMSQLTKLNISRNRLSGIDDVGISQLVDLKYLDISNNINMLEVTSELSSLPKLNHVNLVGLDGLSTPSYVLAKRGHGSIRRYFGEKSRRDLLGCNTSHSSF